MRGDWTKGGLDKGGTGQRVLRYYDSRLISILTQHYDEKLRLIKNLDYQNTVLLINFIRFKLVYEKTL